MPTKVLVFDKNPQRKKMIETALDSDTYLLTFARDGREGVAKFEAFKPDFLIANETLDDIEGLKIFRDLKKTGKITDSQFILMIREGEEEDLVPEKVFFLKKPFKTTDIINLLEEVKMVKDNQSDFDLVEAEMDKVVQNLKKDNDEIMNDISSSSTNPPVVKSGSDDILEDTLEASEELEIIDDLLDANDEELENLIDENENYSSKKLGVESDKEKSKEEELDDLEKELYRGAEEVEMLEPLAEVASEEPADEEEVVDDMLMDLEDITEDETSEESAVEEEVVEEVEMPEEDRSEEELVAESVENVADETEASGIFDDLIETEEITEEMLLESLTEEVVEESTAETEPQEDSGELEVEDITEEDLMNVAAFSEEINDEVETLEQEEVPEAETEPEVEAELETESDALDVLDEAEISDEEFQSAAEAGHMDKGEERLTSLDLDDEVEEVEVPSESEAAHHGIDESLAFGEDLTDEDFAESDIPADELDESLFETKAAEIKAEEASHSSDMQGVVGDIVRTEVEKALEKVLPELGASIEELVKEIAPGIIKKVITEEIEKLKEG